MGKSTKALEAEILRLLRSMQSQGPPKNEAQEYLTAQALKGSKWLDKRDFRDLSQAGGFFSFEDPATQNARRRTITNANATGTFALADNAGATRGLKIQNQYLDDAFARDTAANFQQNISDAAGTVRQGLMQSSDAQYAANALEQQRRLSILDAFNKLYQSKKSGGGGGFLQGLLGAGGAIGASAITKW